MADDLELSLQQARRLAIRSQYLAGPPPGEGIDGMRRVLRGLRVVQIDPVNVVARSHLLVLWSRLGGFDRDDLDTLLWRERWLFEYWAHAASIVLTEDYPIHRAMMQDYTVTVESPRKRDWLGGERGFPPVRPGSAAGLRAAARRGLRGPRGRRLGVHRLDQRPERGADAGHLVEAGRGHSGRPGRAAAAVGPGRLSRGGGPAAGGSGGAGGRARAARPGRRPARDIERHFTIGRYPGLDLERAGWARPVLVEGGNERWWVHRDVFGLLDEEWRPRTTLLSPFDNLICDRERTERLWGLVYRNEMYVPKHKRQFG